MRHLIALLLAVLCLGGFTPRLADAGPGDARVGETRGTYKSGGTPLRAEPSKTSASVASLPRGTNVVVEEARKPWLRVRATVSGAPVSGWIWAFDTISARALAPNQPPPQATRGGRGASRQDISAAGRQLDAVTERGFRASRRDLAQAYLQVDQIERATQTLAPTMVMEFIMDARLRIHPGRSLDRPGRVAGDKDWRGNGRARQPANPGGGALDGILGRLGVDKDVRRGARVVGKLAEGEAARQKQLSERFTPQQEYYLGRAVAAQAIARYGLDPDPLRRRYVRLVGDAVVRLTNRLPANFGGYHFEVLNSDEINGLSGPGGFVFVTRGAVKACRTEDELAAILMHELGHVKLKHGEATLRKGRAFQSWTKGLLGAGAAALGGRAGDFAGKLVKFFGQAATESFRIAAENGYGKNAEFGADLEGSYLLKDVFYDHYALRDLLLHIPQRHAGTATHASTTVRAQALTPGITRLGAFTPREGVKEVRRDRQQKWGLGIGR